MQGFDCLTSAQVQKYEAGLTDQQWREHLWHIWFQRHPSSAKCGFEHVFIGEATEDSLSNSDPETFPFQPPMAIHCGEMNWSRVGSLKPFLFSELIICTTMISPNSDFFFGVDPTSQLFVFPQPGEGLSLANARMSDRSLECMPERMSARSKVRIFMLRILPDDMSETMSEFSGVRVGSTRSFFFLAWFDTIWTQRFSPSWRAHFLRIWMAENWWVACTTGWSSTWKNVAVLRATWDHATRELASTTQHWTHTLSVENSPGISMASIWPLASRRFLSGVLFIHHWAVKKCETPINKAVELIHKYPQ